jgi:cytochrome c553
MLATSESLKQDIEKLSDEQLQQVAEFIAFLRFQENGNV